MKWFLFWCALGFVLAASIWFVSGVELSWLSKP
jgi:hypothetical protein